MPAPNWKRRCVRLTARGDLIELRSGHYVVTARSREFAVGRLNMHATATAS